MLHVGTAGLRIRHLWRILPAVASDAMNEPTMKVANGRQRIKSSFARRLLGQYKIARP
jgi:hypothetical protein